MCSSWVICGCLVMWFLWYILDFLFGVVLGEGGMLIMNWCANFWGFRYLCRYSRDEAWTLVILCTSSIWSCDFCWPEGQRGILEWCLAFPCNFLSCINSKCAFFLLLVFPSLHLSWILISLVLSRWRWFWSEQTCPWH